jgi:hypothetical protein
VALLSTKERMHRDIATYLLRARIAIRAKLGPPGHAREWSGLRCSFRQTCQPTCAHAPLRKVAFWKAPSTVAVPRQESGSTERARDYSCYRRIQRCLAVPWRRCRGVKRVNVFTCTVKPQPHHLGGAADIVRSVLLICAFNTARCVASRHRLLASLLRRARCKAIVTTAQLPTQRPNFLISTLGISRFLRVANL